MEQKNGIILQIAHVNFLSELGDFGVLSNKKPSHVWKEEATLWIVWIGICVGEFMMNAVISHPLNNVFLCGKCLQKYQKVAKSFVGAIWLVCEVSVTTGCDTKASTDEN